jgi:hypothetical protein
MTLDTIERAATNLAAQMLQVYKLEVIIRRAECYARQSNSKQAAWMSFATWANRKGKEENLKLDLALAQWEQTVIVGEGAE